MAPNLARQDTFIWIFAVAKKAKSRCQSAWQRDLDHDLRATQFRAMKAAILAPLQRVMLLDSLSAPEAGHHVEQVEMSFTTAVSAGQVVSAWQETLAQTQALRMAFATTDGEPCGWEKAVQSGQFRQLEKAPASWATWRAADRCEPLLMPQAAPWRVTFWPNERRLMWTFHHALLDGRSITRVLQAFLTRLGGGQAEPLALSQWQPPTDDAISQAAAIFEQANGLLDPNAAAHFLSDTSEHPAVQELGEIALGRLTARASQLGVTAASLLVWSWGQALAENLDRHVVLIDQVRAGSPQPNTAGFKMNTLPVLIRRAPPSEWADRLKKFHQHLYQLRAIEAVAPENFLPGIYPDTSDTAVSVVMIEHATLQHSLAAWSHLAAVSLHEARGHALTATAHLLPRLRLTVEGPDARQLLDSWVMQSLDSCLPS